MKTLEEQLKICSTCQHRTFSLKTGVTCALTKAKPAFEDNCPSYLEKGSVAAPAPAPAPRKTAKKKEAAVVQETETALPKKTAAKTVKKNETTIVEPTPVAAPAPAPAPAPKAKPVAAPVHKHPMQQRPAKPNTTPQELQTLGNASIHTLITLAKLIFLTPYNIWMGAAQRLEKQKADDSLELNKINGTWSILSYIKRITLDFAFDALILLSLPIGIIVTIFFLCSGGADMALIVLACTYFLCPGVIALLHDLIILLLIPLRKYISWGSKPAQYLDINETK